MIFCKTSSAVLSLRPLSIGKLMVGEQGDWIHIALDATT